METKFGSTVYQASLVRRLAASRRLSAQVMSRRLVAIVHGAPRGAKYLNRRQDLKQKLFCRELWFSNVRLCRCISALVYGV